MNTETYMQEIAKSLNIATAAHDARQTRIATLLNGRNVPGWEKLVIGADIFWSKGKLNLTSRQLLNLLGLKLVKCGSLTESEYYK